MLLYIFVGGGGEEELPYRDHLLWLRRRGRGKRVCQLFFLLYCYYCYYYCRERRWAGLHKGRQKSDGRLCAIFFSLLLGARFEIRPSGKRDREGKWNTIFNDAAKKRRKKEKWFRSNGGREEEKRSLSRSEANTSGGSIAMFLWKSSWSKPTDEFPCSAFPPRRKASFIQLEQVVERE